MLTSLSLKVWDSRPSQVALVLKDKSTFRVTNFARDDANLFDSPLACVQIALVIEGAQYDLVDARLWRLSCNNFLLSHFIFSVCAQLHIQMISSSTMSCR